MKKLAHYLGGAGVALATLSIIIDYFGRNSIRWLDLAFYADLALVVAATFVLTAILLSLLASQDTRRIISRDVKIYFWLSGAALLFLVGFLVVTGSKQIADRRAIDQFRKVYYNPERFRSQFLGILSVQYPTDNWVMQEIIAEVKPDFVIETGTAAGGTALFYATIIEKLNETGKVITVDIAAHDPEVAKFRTWNERVLSLRGSSVSAEIFERIKQLVQGKRVLVTLDSDHSKEHVLKEMALYSQLVSINSYMVVQDTQLNGHPISNAEHAGMEGPWEAVQEFLKNNRNFEIDRTREKHLITAHPSGYLKRAS